MFRSFRKLAFLFFIIATFPTLQAADAPRGRIGGQLIGVMKNTVRPNSWEERGGWQNGNIGNRGRNNVSQRGRASSEQLIDVIKTTVRPDSWEE